MTQSQGASGGQGKQPAVEAGRVHALPLQVAGMTAGPAANVEHRPARLAEQRLLRLGERHGIGEVGAKVVTQAARRVRKCERTR